MSQVRDNAIKDPTYAPYCMRCSTFDRMRKVETMYWRCARCGAQHDERSHPLMVVQVERAHAQMLAASMSNVAIRGRTSFEQHEWSIIESVVDLAASLPSMTSTVPVLQEVLSRALELEADDDLPLDVRRGLHNACKYTPIVPLPEE